MSEINEQLSSIYWKLMDFYAESNANWVNTNLNIVRLNKTLQIILICTIAGICVTLLVGSIIIWNQRKLKKQIRHLEDLLQQQTEQAEPNEKE